MNKFDFSITPKAKHPLTGTYGKKYPLEEGWVVFGNPTCEDVELDNMIYRTMMMNLHSHNV